MAIVMIGFAGMLLRGLTGHLPVSSVIVIEEPRIICQRGLNHRLIEFPVVRKIVAVESLTVDGLLELIRPDTIDGIVPGTEVGVVPAARLADALNLPGADSRAAELFRNKIALRTAAAKVGLLQPMWHQLASGTELDAAMRVLGGGAYVLKPASRAGSLGVTIFDSGVDSTAAWQRTHSAVTEAFASAWETTTARYLIEERLAGPEVSVECLIMDHQILFTNVTDKHVLPGAYPVEIGHQVPGPRAAAIQDDLIRCMKRVVDATGFAYGILHGEWILTDGGPALVECAARIPGDRIMELIELAYAVPFTHSYIQVLNGDQPKLPTSPVRGAAIRFLTPEPGAVQRITGQTDAGQIPGVYDVVVQAAEGGQLGPLRASYDRVGHVVATGETSVDAWATAERAARMIGIVTA